MKVRVPEDFSKTEKSEAVLKLTEIVKSSLSGSAI
jgi:hypothetical protein